MPVWMMSCRLTSVQGENQTNHSAFNACLIYTGIQTIYRYVLWFLEALFFLRLKKKLLISQKEINILNAVSNTWLQNSEKIPLPG